MKLEDVLARLQDQLVEKKVIEKPFRKEWQMAKFLGYASAGTIAVYKNKNTIPYSVIIEVCIKHDLDLNYVFKERMV